MPDRGAGGRKDHTLECGAVLERAFKQTRDALDRGNDHLAGVIGVEVYGRCGVYDSFDPFDRVVECTLLSDVLIDYAELELRAVRAVKIEQVLAFGGTADCRSHAVASGEEDRDDPGSNEAVGTGHEDCRGGASESWHCAMKGSGTRDLAW